MDPKDRPDAKSLTKPDSSAKPELYDLQAISHAITTGAFKHGELSEVIEGLIDQHLDAAKDFTFDFNSGWDRYKPPNASLGDALVDKLV